MENIVPEMHVLVDPDELAALAARVPVTPGPLFPWEHRTTGEPIDGEIGFALTTIANARACARVRMEGAGCELHYGAWFTDDGSIAMRPFDEHVLIESPARPDMVAQLAVDIVGASSLRSVDVDAQTGQLAGLLTALSFDEARRDALMALATGTPFVPRGIAGGDGPPLLERIRERTNGVAGLLVHALGDEVRSYTVNEVLDAFDEAVGDGLLTAVGDRFVPAGALRQLGGRALGMSARVDLLGNWCTDGIVERAGFVAAQFGVHDVLVVECVDDRVRFATEPASTIVEHVRAFVAGAPLGLAGGR
jgi:hypothetical protein